MTDIRTRLAQVDRLEPPDDLWEASTSRPPTFDRSPAPGVQTGWRKAGVIAVAFAVFGAAVLFAWSVLDVEPEPPPPVPASDPFASLPAGWTELPEPPEIRCCSAGAWTGSELLIWGGHVGFSDESLDTGWRYDAEAGEWRPMPASPLGARSQAAGVWTGSELLVWGGADYRTDYPYDGYDDGAAFDPATDRWRMLPPAPIDGRQPLAVWTGEEMIVWGSTDREQRRVDGAAYDPEADTWRPIAAAPIELTDATASWTGEEMIVFGAALHGGNRAESRTAIGAAYDPANDSWRQIADSELDTNANTSVWSDGRLLAFDYNLDAAAYAPAADRWTSTGRVPTDECEDVPSSVVVGTAYGQLCGGMVRFDPERNEWRTIDAPEQDFFPDEMFGAGSTLLVEGVVGRFGEGDVRLFAYREPGAASPDAGEEETTSDRAVQAERLPGIDPDVYRVCRVMSLSGDFGGAGDEVVVFEEENQPGIGCIAEGFQHIAVLQDGFVTSLSRRITDVSEDAWRVWPYAAPDLDGDGVDEIAVALSRGGEDRHLWFFKVTNGGIDPIHDAGAVFNQDVGDLAHENGAVTPQGIYCSGDEDSRQVVVWQAGADDPLVVFESTWRLEGLEMTFVSDGDHRIPDASDYPDAGDDRLCGSPVSTRDIYPNA